MVQTILARRAGWAAPSGQGGGGRKISFNEIGFALFQLLPLSRK